MLTLQYVRVLQISCWSVSVLWLQTIPLTAYSTPSCLFLCFVIAIVSSLHVCCICLFVAFVCFWHTLVKCICLFLCNCLFVLWLPPISLIPFTTPACKAGTNLQKLLTSVFFLDIDSGYLLPIFFWFSGHQCGIKCWSLLNHNLLQGTAWQLQCFTLNWRG